MRGTGHGVSPERIGAMRPRRAVESPVALLLAVLPVALLGGCDLSLGLGPGLDRGRDLEGRYEGTFTLEQESFGFAGGGFERFDGTVTIRRRFGSGFSGEWRLRAAGRTLGGDVERGRVDSFGGISFDLETGFGEDVLEALTGCLFLDGERRFHGSVFDGRLRADRAARLRCRLRSGRLETIRFRLSFSGRRDRFL